MLDHQQRYLIVDLECTCWERDPPAPHETIEIGAVVFEPGHGVLDEFQTFVAPVLKPVLSDFCRGLTSIRQSDVDGAPKFPDAFARLLTWASRHEPYMLASWGNFDHAQLQRDCALHGVEYPFERHVNIKRAFSAAMGCKPCGMDGALRKAGLSLEGTHHRGIDDAKNIARLLAYLLDHRAAKGGSGADD